MSPHKPHKNEDEYFVKRDAELLKTTHEMETVKAQQAARRQHLMKCPKDGYDLATKTLHGVQIDACPHCGGFWLDKGELEVLIAHDEKGLLRRVFRDVTAALAPAKRKAME
jgi:Zn-finger nucleic acid-binding protein